MNRVVLVEYWVMKLKNGCEGRASGLICEIVNSVSQGNFIFVREKSGNFRNLFVAVAIIYNVTNSF